MTEKPAYTGQRRLSREIVLRALFLYEVGESADAEEAFDLFCRSFGPAEDEETVLDCDAAAFEQALPFVRELFFGVTSSRETIDRLLDEASDHWRVGRMTRVDRNVMRLALYEMLFRDDIPVKVSINEAIELGKSFGAEDSGAFVNGILDRLHRKLEAGELSL